MNRKNEIVNDTWIWNRILDETADLIVDQIAAQTYDRMMDLIWVQVRNQVLSQVIDDLYSRAT